MTKNPFVNALAASLYISLVVTTMNVVSQRLPNGPTFVGPIAFVSLFTLSAAMMGFLFLYQPFVLYFDKKKKAAISLFVKTLGTFALVTVLLLLLLIAGILR